jgi:2-C-methyl-D-erythritol 2,4-cyclodiphosphate synthase
MKWGAAPFPELGAAFSSRWRERHCRARWSREICAGGSDGCPVILAIRVFPSLISGMTHVGTGYDVHRLVLGRKLILGGVEIPFEKGLDGHSDADVLMHAICDAILGAIGLRDIGTFFPNTDPRWKGAPSKRFLHEAAQQVNFKGGRIVNVDATLIAQQPKIAPYVDQMRENIAAALAINLQKVGVKATTNEHLGFIGREEGIAAMAVASIDLPE